MLELYAKYLEVVDSYLKKCFEKQSPFIKCKCGCTDCCEVGEYPFSRLEMEYLMAGFVKLPLELQRQVRQNIAELLEQKSQAHNGKFLHKCPFLLDKKCVLYERRGLVCRSFGLASFDEVDGQKVVKLPECCKIGLNFSEIYDSATGTADIERLKFHDNDNRLFDLPPLSPLPLLPQPFDMKFMTKELTKGLDGLEFGEIRPIVEWFKS